MRQPIFKWLVASEWFRRGRPKGRPAMDLYNPLRITSHVRAPTSHEPRITNNEPQKTLIPLVDPVFFGREEGLQGLQGLFISL